MHIRRLTAADVALGIATFAMMAEVFDEGDDGSAAAAPELDEAYVAQLLARPDFWAVVALEGEVPVGGVTAHVLPMTRAATRELFLYDVAVRADRQRSGVGRSLLQAVLAMAAQAGISSTFVPAADEDTHAVAFYSALGGAAEAVTFFTWSPPNA
jgi:aminoglycoside 3-N-acetyltransferase I